VGSRRGRYAALAVVAAVACKTGGTPSGFSGGAGDRWTFPLVGPLEDGLLVTPVTINGRGPYLMALDPDAPDTVVDAVIVKEEQLLVGKTEDGKLFAELTGVEIGTLIVEQRRVLVVKAGTFDGGGRGVHGVIGRDILDDSLVLGIDRDQGLAFLQVKKTFKPPAGAVAVPFKDEVVEQAGWRGLRRVVPATIGGETFAMHVDLGAVASQLGEVQWERAKLASRDVQLQIIDEGGEPRMIARASEPATVTVAGQTTDRVAFIPYVDRGLEAQVGKFDGSLGLNYFAPYIVWADFPAHTIYLVRRTGNVPLTKKLERWDTGPLGGKCEHPACVAVRLVDPLQGKPPEEGKPHPGLVLALQRDERAGGMPLEIVLEARTGASPAATALPRLIVNMPANIDRLIDHLGPEFLGTTLEVIDASPYPRACPTADGCVDQLAR
jgi:hypothetical protein